MDNDWLDPYSGNVDNIGVDPYSLSAQTPNVRQASGNGGTLSGLSQALSQLNLSSGQSPGFDATSGMGVMPSSDPLGIVPDYTGDNPVGTYGVLPTG